MYSSITMIALVLLSVVSVSYSFGVAHTGLTIRKLSIRSSPALHMANDDEEGNEAPFSAPKKLEENPELKFDMNKRVRLGRSRDQDGKSNIWSIEPAMEVCIYVYKL